MKKQLLKSNFAQNIDYLIKKYAGTQAEFANKIGVTEAAVNKWRNDKAFPGGKYCDKIKEIYGYDLTDLLKKDISISETKVAEKQAEYNVWKLHADPHIDQLLKDAIYILESDHEDAIAAITSNIKCFKGTVDKAERLAILESKIETLEKEKKVPPDVPLSGEGGRH